MDKFSLGIMRNGGIGIAADALKKPDPPYLATRLARAIGRVYETWEAASPADREAFWSWLFPESEGGFKPHRPQPCRSRQKPG